MACEKADAFIRLLELARTLGGIKSAHLYGTLLCVEGDGFQLSLRLDDGGAADVCQSGGAVRCIS